MSAVEAWFGEHFATLHPQLQALHRLPLTGQVLRYHGELELSKI